MTNNLKAERTLTAFDAWFNEQEGYSLRSERFDGDVEWLKAAFEAGALSTQQRMGEVTVPMVERAARAMFEDGAVVSWDEALELSKIRAGSHYASVMGSFRRSAKIGLNAALHPNQESGE